MGNVTAKTNGDIASFMTPAETNIKSLKVHFSPKQLGEGDPSPENVREIVGWDGVEIYQSGNILVPNDVPNRASAGITWTTNVDGSVHAKGTATAHSWYSSDNAPVHYLKGNVTYKLSGGTSNVGLYFVGTSLDGTRWAEAKIGGVDRGTGRTFTLDQDAFVRWQCWVLKNTTVDEIIYPKLEVVGFEAPIYKPYQGTTIPIDFTNNYLNKVQITNNKTINSTGEEITESGMSVTDYIPVNENEEWILSFISTATARTRRFWGYDENKQIVSELAKISWANIDQEYTLTANITGDVKYIRVCYYTNDTDLLLTIDGTSFKNVYGGYIDLISGELVENVEYKKMLPTWTWRRFIFDNEKYQYYANVLPTSDANTHNRTVFCNMFKSILINERNKTENNKTAYRGSESFCFRYDEIKTVEDWVTYVSENDIYVADYLVNPITHQLTPTQLSSFIGQNNFWSNADYVEVEYELKETEDIQKARKKIILNQPQLKSISDKIVSFNTDMVAPLKNCKIYFNPIQLGSGDPSPTNVRNINGWTSIDSYANGNKVSVDWTNDIGTVYGGYVDLVKGELIATHVIFEKKWSEYSNNYAMTDVNRRSILFPYERRKIGAVKALCNIAPPAHDLQNKIHFYIAPENNYVYMFLPKDLDEETLIQVASKIEEPIHYQLTPQQLLTFKSTNHIWSETNGQQIDVKYWTHKNLTPTPLTNYIENQTWTDSAYISSSGKKTTNTVSASHFLTNQILLEAGTYVLSGFSHYVGTDNTNFRIHAYDSTGKWLRQITFQQIGNLSPVDISFTLDTDTYVNVSIAMDFDGVLAKIN